MYPVLFSIGNFSISSFGFLTALAFLYGVFLVWRLSRAWEMDEEKVLDLTLLTFLGGLIVARLYFILENFSFFGFDMAKIFFVHKYPGFSLWGAFLGGWLTLYYFVKKFKLDFWQVADMAAVGFLGGLILGDIGCFLGGCDLGRATNSLIGIDMVGVVGKRLPVQLLEAILLSIVLRNIWSQSVKFHIVGKIVALSLIYLGLIKFFTEFFRDSNTISGFILSIIITALGLTVYYKVHNASTKGMKRNPLTDLRSTLKFLTEFLTNREIRNIVLVKIFKGWYNRKTTLVWKFRNFNKALRRANVRTTPKDN